MEFMQRMMASFGMLMARNQQPTQVVVHTTPDVTRALQVFSRENGDDAKLFCEEVERASAQQAWPDSIKISTAVSKLRGSARDWHSNFGTLYDEWFEWKTAFLQQFFRPKSLVELTNELQKRRQGAQEPLQDYVQAKLKIFSNSGIAVQVQDKVDSLCQGMRNPNTRSVLWQQYDNLNSFLEQVRIRDRYETNERDYRNTPRASNATAAEAKTDETANATEKQPATGEKARGPRCFNCNKAGRLSRDCP